MMTQVEKLAVTSNLLGCLLSGTLVQEAVCQNHLKYYMNWSWAFDKNKTTLNRHMQDPTCTCTQGQYNCYTAKRD